VRNTAATVAERVTGCLVLFGWLAVGPFADYHSDGVLRGGCDMRAILRVVMLSNAADDFSKGASPWEQVVVDLRHKILLVLAIVAPIALSVLSACAGAGGS
jgi:hypothetical protein